MTATAQRPSAQTARPATRHARLQAWVDEVAALTQPDEVGRWYPGDIVSYRCQDCLDRWDLVLPELDDGRGD